MLGFVQTESEVRADYIGVSQYLKRRMVGGIFMPVGDPVWTANTRFPRAPSSTLHREFESRKRIIPLLTDGFQRAAGLCQLRRFEFP